VEVGEEASEANTLILGTLACRIEEAEEVGRDSRDHLILEALEAYRSGS
jgi:hypothetical protein